MWTGTCCREKEDVERSQRAGNCDRWRKGEAGCPCWLFKTMAIAEKWKLIDRQTDRQGTQAVQNHQSCQQDFFSYETKIRVTSRFFLLWYHRPAGSILLSKKRKIKYKLDWISMYRYLVLTNGNISELRSPDETILLKICSNCQSKSRKMFFHEYVFISMKSITNTINHMISTNSYHRISIRAILAQTFILREVNLNTRR